MTSSTPLILSAASRVHYHSHPGQLSIKTMTNGRARYTLSDGRRIAVDDTGYLILNEQQPYTIEIESPTVMHSFCIFFPDGLAAQILHALTSPLDDPDSTASTPAFFETLLPHDDLVSPILAEIRAAHTSDTPASHATDPLWLDERIHLLVARMLHSQRHHLTRQSAALSAARPATRDELIRRLNIARDYMHASLADPLTLSEIAAVAALSPFHFQRAFKQAFGLSPHDYLTARRIEQAQFWLRSTDLPVTEICYAVGFTSPGSFSTLFTRHVGVSPRAYRQYNLRPNP